MVKKKSRSGVTVRVTQKSVYYGKDRSREWGGVTLTWLEFQNENAYKQVPRSPAVLLL